MSCISHDGWPEPSARLMTAGGIALLLWLGLTASVSAQSGAIAGRVIDAGTQQPVSGAQIIVDNTGTGTISDAQGQFRLDSIPGSEVTLRVEMIGYRGITETIAVGMMNVRLALSQSAVELDEILVTGTAGGTQRRALGNSVASLQAADVQAVLPAADVTRMINGRAPGVQVAPGTGMVGAGPRIRIRGAKSLSLSDQPLIYVDGVRVDNDVASGPANQGYGSGSISRLGDFNPDDIQSIEIIKGPAAATLYGTEASAGVVQIITKKGRAGSDAQWNLIVRQGANWFHDPENRVPMNWGVAPDGEVLSVNLVQRESERGTPLFRTGHIQEYGLSVRGGSGAARYFISGKYESSEGIDVNNNVWRYSARSNLGFTPGDNWNINTSFGFTKASIGLASDIGSGVLFNTMFSTNVDVDGPRRGFRSAPPEAFLQRSHAHQGLDRFTGSVQVEHRLAESITQRLIVGVDQTNEKNTTINPFLDAQAAQFFSGTAALGSKSAAKVAVTYNTVDYGATLRLPLSESLTSATSIGAQYYRRQTEILSGSGSEFTGPGLTTISGTARSTSNEDLIENVTVGTFIQEEIGWKDRLFMTAALRVDNNSAFGSDFDFVTYPKVSGSWVINEEPFWNVDWISTLRVRAAYGQSGQQPETFAALRTFQPVTISGGQGGVTPQFIGNPELSPERSSELEAGFEAGLFNDRLALDFSAYTQSTKDAILLRSLAPSGGFPGAQYVNVGELANRGAELQLTAQVVGRESVGWEIGFNISKNESEVKDVSGAASAITADGRHYIRMGSNLDTPGIHLRHQEGYPAGSWFGRKVVSAQLDADGQAINVMCAGGEISASPLPCDEAPEIYLGRSDPDVEGSLSTTLTLFGQLTVAGLVDFKQGVRHGENDTLVRCALFHNCEVNFFPERFDPVFVAQVQSGSWHDFAVADASFVKLRELSVSYLLPGSITQRIGADVTRLTLTGRNLKTWTDWPSLDPETYFLSHQFDKWSQTFTPHPMSVLLTVNVTY
ncbi:MAG: TonB-dependent receptor domain-containing protein [Longimicrobiales bacterium]